MSWLFPGFLAGILLVGLPVVLHLLRRKPQDVVRFPSLRFLGTSALRDTRRNQLLRWLVLLCRCLAIALLCFAFARPFWGKAPTAINRALVIALDNSMSQQSRGRWEDTVHWSLAQLDQLHPGDQAALLLMEPEPVWIVPMTDNLTRIRTALAEVKAGYDQTRYARSLRQAADTLTKTDAHTKILAWAADEQLAGWRGTDLAQKLPPGITFQFLGIQPAPQRQAAIVAVRRSPNTKGSLEVTLRQYHPSPDRRELSVYDGDKKIAGERVSLRPGEKKINIACDWPPGAPGLRVSLDPDDLPADDAAWIAAPETTTNVVMLDTAGGTDFLVHALRATQKIEGAGFEPMPLPDHSWPAESAVILRSEASFREPAVERLNQFCESGGAVWIFVDGSAAQKTWLKEHGVTVTTRGAADEPWHLRDWDAERPALSAFAGHSLLPLLEVEFYRGFNLGGDTLEPVANWPDGKMAVAEVNSGGRRLFITGFALDREATDWPAQASFVPFVHCVARQLSAFQETHSDWRVGDFIPLPEEQGTWRALDAPVSQPALAVNHSVRPSVPGLYEFTGRSVKKTFAVNTPAEESDLSPWPNPDQLASLETTESQASAPRHSLLPAARIMAENRQRLWWWLLAAGTCVLLVELALANRTSS